LGVFIKKYAIDPVMSLEKLLMIQIKDRYVMNKLTRVIF
jgi:hypothetical protein